MRFAFSDTQLALRDVSRDLFTRESPPSRVRELWDGKPFDRRVWRLMAETGLCGLLVPEDLGGAGGDEVDLAQVHEEAGRAALPEPLLETAGVAAPLLAEGAGDGVRERWLPAIASGEAIVAVQAPGEPFVPWAAEADLLILTGEAGPRVLEPDACRISPVRAVDPSRPLATVEADPGAGSALDPQAWERAVRRGAFGAASHSVGVSGRLLERTVGYVSDRKQFGRAVGSFQAVKHKLASMHQAIELARPAVMYAAYAIARDLPEAGEAAAVAKVVADDASELCDREALQCHGGIGFTWEDDLHLWLKRAMTMRASWGTASDHARTLAPAVMGS